MAGVANDRREPSSSATATRALGPRTRRVFPASSRRSGPAYQNSRPNVSAAKAMGDNIQDQARPSVQLFTSRLARKYLGAASGFTHWKKSPIDPPCACPGSCVGSRNRRYRHRLTKRLVLFELHQKPTNIANAVNANVRTHARPAPHRTAW